MDNWSSAAFVAAVFEAQLFLAVRVRVYAEEIPLSVDMFRGNACSCGLLGRSPVMERRGGLQRCL
ncbi:hypothetical protein COCC4DRAFT_32931 [Bipolaris maydis ATCC 48331]|uniref:Secreted protein n=2 Tax=Cochliobolus heterostrophus TaxID=5016 RepID=M2VAB0_COCH5|nr:uncharacterized protein COCC4DRAFT_32931 [Bipolaris maydis ATCC 48331]EMD96882.1 hypothetical protein COCHEDRAFT_1018617 [Bipolaris maydis C5]KAJ5020708.1 hypothetical protein J3E73DRAFT_358973 [Bipolaris maydis]ENI03751.1 hypothetical protein COCC4DRAFT_32931 [Bipolaris maydis ATCC 48331]KAJ5031244.1 hypothetical protein J3E73DRAFT_265594 [Bipolaris maydis]KAJ6273886.1 hypothetical protein PSV08DRAFT_277762 [Bipolaris maydis]